MKYMINSVKFTCFFISSKIPGVLHYHNRTVISFGIAADWAHFFIRKGVAALTVLYVHPGIGDGIGKLLYLFLWHIHNMKSQALGRFCPDSRKMGKLLNQFIDMTAVVFHQNGRPPPNPPRPPVSLDITA